MPPFGIHDLLNGIVRPLRAGSNRRKRERPNFVTNGQIELPKIWRYLHPVGQKNHHCDRRTKAPKGSEVFSFKSHWRKGTFGR